MEKITTINSMDIEELWIYNKLILFNKSYKNKNQLRNCFINY